MTGNLTIFENLEEVSTKMNLNKNEFSEFVRERLCQKTGTEITCPEINIFRGKQILNGFGQNAARNAITQFMMEQIMEEMHERLKENLDRLVADLLKKIYKLLNCCSEVGCERSSLKGTTFCLVSQKERERESSF